MNSSNLIDALKRYDFSFVGIMSAIFFIGLINLYSATHSSANLQFSNLYQVQLMWFALSMVVAFFISFISPKTFFRFSYPLYFLGVVLLVLVLALGEEGMGAVRWIRIGPIRLQPSEVMKVSLVLALARWFSRKEPDRELGLKEMILPFIIAGVPALLVAMGPDLGTCITILLIFFMVAFYRKLTWKAIGIIFLASVISGGALYQFGLKDYQRRRIHTFIDPNKDALGSGYNAIQSKIAIGSGQFLGKGFKKSSQASLNYLPENHTDFVFSVFNEEHGFLGSLFLLSLYLVLFFRFLWLASVVTRIFDSIIIVGLMSIFFWHTLVNMAMVMGLLPIVGLPLPLMSYGGSSLLTFGICAGLATSISNSRNLF